MKCSLEQLQIEVVPVAGHGDITLSQQDSERSHTVNVVLDVLQDVFCIRVLSNRFSEPFRCGWF